MNIQVDTLLKLVELLSSSDKAENASPINSLIGKTCVFRTYSAGVHFGVLKARNGKECLVRNSRRIWSWEGACSLSQIAVEGSTAINNCKIAMLVPTILLTEVIEVIPMSEEAIEILYGAKEWKR